MMENQSLYKENENYLNQIIKVTFNNLVFALNKKEKTASLIDNNAAVGDVIIPKSIEYKSQMYIVVCICESSFQDALKIKSIQFPDDSEVRKIEKSAFKNSTVESITFPPNLVELDDGWCSVTCYLKEIKISPNNHQFKTYQDKFILGKSNQNSDKFDVLVFGCRCGIETIKIPSFIKKIGADALAIRTLKCVNFEDDSELQKIGSYAFYLSLIEKINIPPHLTQICEGVFSHCSHLKSFIIPKNSELQIIEKNAFFSSGIEYAMIPPHLTKLEDFTFGFCINLKKIDIPINSELKTIGKFAFFVSTIEKFSISSNLEELKEDWCWCTPQLREFSVNPNNKNFQVYENKYLLRKSDSNSKNFDVLVLARRDIKTAYLPAFIKQIGQHAFNGCKKLQQIKIPKNSKLQSIDKSAFNDSTIEKIYLPSGLNELKEGWCYSSEKLKEIIVDPNNQCFRSYENKFILGKSNQQNAVFDVIVFANRNITEAIIPSFIKQIGPYAFNECNQLRKIEFKTNSELQIIGTKAFHYSAIESISIPSSVSQICEDAFLECINLYEVEIPLNSELKTIGKAAFSETSIENIFIPQYVSDIEENAFSTCRKLGKVEFQTNSNLKVIGKNAFTSVSIESIAIPNQINRIDDEAFKSCQKLKRIEFKNNSQLQTIGEKVFAFSSIESLSIPSNVSYINSQIFKSCNHFQIIEIPDNSNLKFIDSSMFYGSEQALIMIPFKLNYIVT